MTTVQTRHAGTAATPRAAARRAVTVTTALIVLGLGALTVLAFYLPIVRLQAADSSAAAMAMKDMRLNRLSVFWAFPLLQAAGFAALIWAYIGLALGLMEAGAATRWRWLPLTPTRRLQLHRHISLLVLGLILVHVLATAFDAMGDNLRTVFVPWQTGWGAAVLAYNLGIFALYAAVLVGPTYYIRRYIGARRWRVIHRLAAVVYVLSVWHALIIGADVAYYPWVRPLMWLLQIPLLVLFIRRVLEQAASSRAREARRALAGVGVGGATGVGTRATCYVLAGLGAVVIAGVLAIVATGHSGTVVTSIQF